MSDFICRRDVYNALESVKFVSEKERRYAFSLLEQIPSALPEAKYYDCSCYIPYPNENHRFKNGKSKCDRYRPVKFTRKSIYGCVTRCKRVTERG